MRVWLVFSLALCVSPQLFGDLTFTFKYNDPDGQGFNADGATGEDRRDALQLAARNFGSAFSSYTANIVIDVDGTEEDSTLAAAGSAIGSTFSPGFGLGEVIRNKVLNGMDLNMGDTDGSISVNFAKTWELDMNAIPSDGDFDWYSIMYHEFAHTFGFSSSIRTDNLGMDATDAWGTVGATDGQFGAFDQFLSNSAGVSVFDFGSDLNESTYESLLIGGDSPAAGLFFNGPNAIAANDGKPVGLYSPTTYDEGSSGSHLDDNNASLAGSMMLAATGPGPGARLFSPIELGIFKDIGYTNVAQVLPEPMEPLSPRFLYWSEDGAGTISRATLDGDRFTPDPTNPILAGLDRVHDVEVVGNTIYWAGWTGSQAIHQANLDDPNIEPEVLAADVDPNQLNGPYGVAVDPIGRWVYWTDHNAGTIHRANLDDGSDEQTLIDGLENPHDIEIDVEGGKIYWVDPGTGTIQRADLNGENVECVQKTPGPHGLALDLTHRKMYWTDHRNQHPHRVLSAAMEPGSIDDQDCRTDAKTIIDAAPNGSDIVLDVDGGKMYWTEENTRIRSSRLDGTDAETLIDGLQILVGLAIVPEPLPGDFNRDGICDVHDIDLLMGEIKAGKNNPLFDLGGSPKVDHTDLVILVKDLKNTWFGDANLDGEFNSNDLIAIFQAGEYEDDVDGNSGWADGDWNADGDFDSTDLVVAFADGGYEHGPRVPLVAVPEPGTILVISAAFGMFVLGRRTV